MNYCYCIIVLYHWYNVQFLNIIENDKLSWEICSSKVAFSSILPFYFRLEGAAGKTSQEAEVKSSKWLNRDGTKIRCGFLLIWQGKITQSRWNSIVSILNSPPTDHKVLEAMTMVTLSSSPPELYDPSVVSLKLIRSNFILIKWFYLVRIEEIHV